MHKSYKKTVTVLILVALIGALLSIPVSASTGLIFTMPLSQPPINNYSGYVEVLVREKSTGNYGTYVYLLSTNLVLDQETEQPYLFEIDVGSSGIYFRGLHGLNELTCINVYCVSHDGSMYYTGLQSSSGEWLKDTYTTEICGVKTYGNFYNNDYNNWGTPFTCVYGNDSASYTVLQSILAQMQSQAGSVESAINSQTQNDNQNAADIQANQDKNTQAQIQADKDLQAQENATINSSGNTAASDASSNIPNKSEGFISSLRSFVGAMSTTNTSCSITFPALTVPSVAGFPGATISEEREVDFSDSINLIPSEIMSLIQAVTTLALIVFSFKELYDTISEALTRRKSDE